MARRNSRKQPAAAIAVPRRRRAIAVAVLLAMALVGLISRAAQLQVRRHDHFAERAQANHRTRVTVHARRGEIRDRHGRPLAINADAPSVYVVPRDVRQPDEIVETLATALDIERPWLQKRIAGEAHFRWIKRLVSPGEAKAVEQGIAGGTLTGVAIAQESRRYYPNRALAGPILGFVDRDGKGIEGLERDYEQYLRGKEHVLGGMRDARGRQLLTEGYLPLDQLSGCHIVLTIDARIQHVAEAVLADQVREMEARGGGVVVVLDPHTGDILALAQWPTFDPNFYQLGNRAAWRNRAATHVLEPGSTIKPLLIASALDAGKVRPATVFDGMKGRLKIGRKTIRDVHAEKTLTTYQIVQKSSNVGAVQVAQRLGRDLFYSYLRGFGFGETTDSGIRGELTGRLRNPRRWGQIHLATHAYGYGLSVTPLQMALAIAAIANGGHLVRPRIVREIVDARAQVVEQFSVRRVRRVVSAKAARQATEAMILVTQDGGTGRRARVPGYLVAGKTGTAYKVDVGGYSRTKVTSSFVGFVPAKDPRLLIYVAIDEPQQARYGGVVAAPIFRRIAQETLPYLGVEPTEPFDKDDLDDLETDDDLDEEIFAIDPQVRSWWLEMPEITGEAERPLVPDFRGATLGEIVREAARLGASLKIVGAGLAISQKPSPGVLLERGQTLEVAMAVPGRISRPDSNAGGRGP